MTTPARRRTRPAKRRRPRHSRSAREKALLCAALGLGLAGGLAVLAGFGLDFRGLRSGAIAERASTVVLADATPAVDPVSDPAPDVPAVPDVRPIEDKKPEPPVTTPVPDPEPPPVPAPAPEPPAAPTATLPARPRAVLSENELHKQLYQAPEVGL